MHHRTKALLESDCHDIYRRTRSGGQSEAESEQTYELALDTFEAACKPTHFVRPNPDHRACAPSSEVSTNNGYSIHTRKCAQSAQRTVAFVQRPKLCNPCAILEYNVVRNVVVC